MNYKIIASGKQNAVLYHESILVDIGVSYKKLAPHVKGIKLVLLTHEHGDHIVDSTIVRLHKERPTVRFGVREWMLERLLSIGIKRKNIDLYEEGVTYSYGNLSIKSEWVPHNKPNCCYHIIKPDYKILHATDLFDISHIVAIGYDLYCIEKNWIEATIDQIIQRQIDEGNKYPHGFESKLNHLSDTKYNLYIFLNGGPNSKFVPLHISDTYGIERESE